MGPICRDSRTAIEKQVDEFDKMLSYMPAMRRYTYNKMHTMTYTKAWANGQFGGNVYKPLGSYTKSKVGKLVASKRTRTNMMKEDVRKT